MKFPRDCQPYEAPPGEPRTDSSDFELMMFWVGIVMLPLLIALEASAMEYFQWGPYR